MICACHWPIKGTQLPNVPYGGFAQTRQRDERLDAGSEPHSSHKARNILTIAPLKSAL